MMRVTQDNNFCRVFMLPARFPSDFCFGGGHPVEFRMVDWFNPVPPDPSFGGEQFAFLKWVNGVCELDADSAEKMREATRSFIALKRYIKPGCEYLVITDYGDAFLLNRQGSKESASNG